MSPQEAGRLSGLARRIKRDGRVDLTQVPSLLPVLQKRIQQLREQPALLDLQEDVLRLTALQDVLLSGQLDIEAGDLVRMLAILTQVKANALKAKFLLETPTMVRPEKVQAMIVNLVGLLKTYTPDDRQQELARDLVLLGASPTAVASLRSDAGGAT